MISAAKHDCTLRDPLNQLRRKVEAVSLAISSDPELCALLDLTEDRVPTHHHGWIADTPIECDHHRIAGFLNVSEPPNDVRRRERRLHSLAPPGRLCFIQASFALAVRLARITSRPSIVLSFFSGAS